MNIFRNIDFTISDFVADMRAPTPSAAAELVASNVDEISARLHDFKRRLVKDIHSRVQTAKQKVQLTQKRLVDPKRKLQELMQRCDELADRLKVGVRRQMQSISIEIASLRKRLPEPSKIIAYNREKIDQNHRLLVREVESAIEDRKQRLGSVMQVLDSLSPLKVVERGYSLSYKSDELIKDVSQVKKGDTVEVQFARGRAQAKIEKVLNKDEIWNSKKT